MVARVQVVAVEVVTSDEILGLFSKWQDMLIDWAWGMKERNQKIQNFLFGDWKDKVFVYRNGEASL